MHAFSRPFLDVLILAAGSILGISTFAWDKVKSVMAQGWLTNQGTVEFGSVEQRTTNTSTITLRGWTTLIR